MQTETIDPRPEGVYIKCETYPLHSSNEYVLHSLVIERVNGDGSVSELGCTYKEAGVLLRLLSACPNVQPKP